MSKRLQVVLDDGELRRYEECAEAEGLTLSAWVRQSLRAAEREVSTADPGRKLAAIRAAYAYSFPAPDIEVMLDEIEQGYADVRFR
jgi:hypothetical protein